MDEISTGGDSYDIWVMDDLAYVTCGYGGLRVFNVSNPSDIVQVAHLPEWSNGYSHQMAIENNIVYIGDGRAGLWGTNCTDSINPTTCTNFLGGYTWDVQIDAEAEIAFLADGGSYFGIGENGLKILDIHNISSPVLLGQYITGGDATDIEVIGNTAYLVTGLSGLMIFDISNYANPVLMGQVLEPFNELEASLGSVKVIRDLVYLTYWQGGLFIYNVSNPSHITVVGEFLKGDELFSVEVEEELNLAFVVDQSQGLKIFDINIPNQSYIVANYSDGSAIYSDVYYSGNYLYLITDTGLKILKIDIEIDEETTTSTDIIIQEIGQIDTSGRVRDVVVIEDIAYVADMGVLPLGTNAGFLTIDVSNPSQPVKLGEFSDGGSAHHLFNNTEKEVVFIADNVGGFEVISISDPLNPTKIGHFNGHFNDLDVKGDIVYTTDYFQGLVVLDVSNLTHPIELGRYTDLIPCQPIHVVDNIAYLTGTDVLHVLDVTDPTNITKIAQYDYKTSNIQIIENSAYMACKNGFFICDVSNPHEIVEIGSGLIGDYLIDIYVKGDISILSDRYNGIKILNISDPSNPTVITGYNDGGDSLDIYVVGDLIYVANGEDGLEILKISGLYETTTASSPSTTTPTSLETIITDHSTNDISTTEEGDSPSFELLMVILGLIPFLNAKRRQKSKKKVK
ncbi:MAG: LVIVD repeat-containing protein [Promethearchaeota archaeon]